MEQSLDRRELLKKAGAALGGGMLLGLAMTAGEQPAQATGTYSNDLQNMYYVVYPPFFTDRYLLSFSGIAQHLDMSTVYPPDFFVLHVEDKDANVLYGPFTLYPPNITISGTGGYTRGGLSLGGPLNAGSVRIWIDAYWGSNPSNYTHMERSVKTFGQDVDPTGNAYMPCYSGC